MYLLNSTTGDVIAQDVREIRNPFSRMVGLLTRSSVGPAEGIWLTKCPAVHTLGMRATIDLIFLDGANRVLGTAANATPNKPFFSCKGAKAVVELGAGSKLGLVEPGHVLQLSSTDRPTAVTS